MRLGAAVGVTFREHRQRLGLSLQDVALAMRLLGFNWSVSRVVELEAGKVSPTLGVLVGLLQVLREEDPDAELALPDLLPRSDELLEIAPGVTTTAAGLRDFLAGRASLTTGASARWMGATHERAHSAEAAKYRSESWTERKLIYSLLAYGVADERAAREFGLPLGDFLNVTASVWGRSLTEERDRRAPDGANPQELGRITRALLGELRASPLLDHG